MEIVHPGHHGTGPDWPCVIAAGTLRHVTRRRFGTFLIDLAARELSDDGRPLQLSPRVFDCIAYLSAHPDRAIGRDELMAGVWGKADVSDSQLAQVILRARRAVGDSGEAQRVIRTVAGFGYRWVAETTEDIGAPARDVGPTPAPDTPDDVPASVPPRAIARAGWSPRRIAVILSLLLPVIAAVALLSWPRNDTRSDRPVAGAGSTTDAMRRAVAVLPVTVDADDEWRWLRLGAMEFVGERLRNAGQIVAPSETVLSIARGATTARTTVANLRTALDLQWIVAPTVRKSDTGWVARLELSPHEGDTREFQGEAADPITATRLATERLLAVLGPADIPGDTLPPQAEELLSRVDAALLVDDAEGARRLLATTSDTLRATPEVQLREATIQFTVGRNDDAETTLLALLPSVSAESDPLLRARLLSLLGGVHIRMGRAADAEQDMNAALALLERLDAPALLGKAYMRRGVARAGLGDSDAALADLALARIAMGIAADTLGQALVELNEGALHGQRNHPADALASFIRAEKHFERFDVPGELANALTNQVLAHRLLLQPDEALAASERSLRLLGRVASIEATHLIQIRRAQALADVGRWTEAITQFEELSRAVDHTREQEIGAMADTGRAHIELARARPETALALARPVVDLLTAPEFASVRQEAWLVAIAAQRALGREREATDMLAAFRAWADASGNPVFALRGRLAQAELDEAAGRTAEADALYAQALAEANRDNVPAGIADVATAYANALIARGDLERAVPVVGIVDRYAARNFDAAVLQVRLYRALERTEAWRSALARARALAGERPLPADILVEPARSDAGGAIR